MRTNGNLLSVDNIKRTTDIGRKIREQREAMRAALDNRSEAPTDENGGWHFANENGVLTALAIGPTVPTGFA